jgi:holliday junction DNA helicase RuvA
VIAHLRGRVAHRDAGSVVVDVGGVGYLVNVTPGDRVPARGEPVELHTSLQVREESMTLYGFTDRPSLQLFELLLTSSGVGPKLALAAIATHRPDVLRTAIAGADLATLTAIPGVGKKVAERLVLELKDKVGGPATGAFTVNGDGGTGSGSSPLGEVRDALLGLGYSAGEVQGALADLGTSDDLDTSELLRRALRHLGAAAYDGARS